MLKRSPVELPVVTISGFRKAKLPKIFDQLNVALGTEENIYDQEYVSCVINESRVVRVLKSSLVFTHD